jgi:hypothetical protein
MLNSAEIPGTAPTWANRRYLAVNSDNRLVVGSLEARTRPRGTG